MIPKSIEAALPGPHSEEVLLRKQDIRLAQEVATLRALLALELLSVVKIVQSTSALTTGQQLSKADVKDSTAAMCTLW